MPRQCGHHFLNPRLPFELRSRDGREEGREGGPGCRPQVTWATRPAGRAHTLGHL